MRPLLLVLLVVSLLSGCSNAPPTDEAGSPLCAAAAADTATAARDAFGAAHDQLHRLARDLQEIDERAAAARLLEAKQAVEAAVAEELPLQQLRPRLDDLLGATTEATRALDEPTPTCDT